MSKWLFVLTLIILPIASAKTYGVEFQSPSIVGKVQLPPGHYTLKLDGSNAIFTNENGKSFETAVSTQQTAKKFADTEVESRTVAGKQQVQEIRLRGTKMKLEFN